MPCNDRSSQIVTIRMLICGGLLRPVLPQRHLWEGTTQAFGPRTCLHINASSGRFGGHEMYSKFHQPTSSPSSVYRSAKFGGLRLLSTHVGLNHFSSGKEMSILSTDVGWLCYVIVAISGPQSQPSVEISKIKARHRAWSSAPRGSLPGSVGYSDFS